MRGFLVLDMIIGLLLISIVAAMAFSTISHQRILLQKSYETDLSKRTAVNILVRKVMNAEIPEQVNSFDIQYASGKIDLKSSEKIYVYQVGDDRN
ncbi:MAG: hypothetical protein ACPLVG_06655 [Pseudothermotoga sp.]